MYMEKLLKGCVDLHLHVSPSLMPRIMDIVEMAHRAEEFGYKAIVHKDHHSSTAHLALMVKKHLFTESNLQIFGSIALNNAVGGLSLPAVEVAIGFGARIVWLPTTSAKNHIEFMKSINVFPKLKDGLAITEEPIVLLDHNGELKESVVRILEKISQVPNVAIGAGHSSAEEIDAVVQKVAEMGIANRLMIDHPTEIIGASLDDIQRWASKGVFIELIAAMSSPVSSHITIPIDDIVEIIRLVGPKQTILSSDFGQKSNADPVVGHDAFLCALDEKGISEEDLKLMSSFNPAKLIGLPI